MEAGLEPSCSMALLMGHRIFVARAVASPRGEAFLVCLTPDIHV